MRALRTDGRSPWLSSWIHSEAESARWSNLAGQILHSKHRLGGGQLGIGHIDWRFAEHGGDGFLKQVAVNAFHIIAVQQAQSFQALNANQLNQFMLQALASPSKPGFFST